jgi:uncharacterized membrane protein YeaQ/YmgE (transglycosylase-associated protein family)
MNAFLINDIPQRHGGHLIINVVLGVLGAVVGRALLTASTSLLASSVPPRGAIRMCPAAH